MKKAAFALAGALALAACEEEVAPGPDFAHYAARPTPIRLVQVLDGKPDAERRALLVRALELHGIAYTREPYVAGGEAGENIEIALGPGPDELVVGAHTDRVERSGGANDNASCVAAALATYRSLAAGRPLRHIRVRFLFFDDEENGLRGSRAFLRHADLSAIKGAVSLELCGIGDALGIWDIRPREERSLVVEALKRAGRAEGVYVGTHGPVPRFGSDHVNFQKKGLPAVGLTVLPRADESTLRDYVANPNSLRWLFRWLRPTIFRTYHHPSDTAETVRPAALAMAARVLGRAVRDFDDLTGAALQAGLAERGAIPGRRRR